MKPDAKKSKPKKPRRKPAHRLPDVLYVCDSDATIPDLGFVGNSDLSNSDPGDVVGVYKLEKVGTIKQILEVV